jgi:hypothetical protein
MSALQTRKGTEHAEGSSPKQEYGTTIARQQPPERSLPTAFSILHLMIFPETNRYISMPPRATIRISASTRGATEITSRILRFSHSAALDAFLVSGALEDGVYEDAGGVDLVRIEFAKVG